MFRVCLCAMLWLEAVRGQSNKDLYDPQYRDPYAGKQYDGSKETSLPNPGDSNYRTYVYNSRRYGVDTTRYNPYNPNINQPGGFPYNPLNTNPLDEQFKFNTNRDANNPDALFPGVLGGWREDLQGRERRDSRLMKRDIFVNTNYGQVQGFKVYLYDNPDPMSGYRPWLSPVERVQGEVSVFLGIPYARPPVLEGRFKPPRQHPGWQLLQAVDWGPACPQPVRHTGATKGIRDMDEDCLYLNIFSPNTEAGATAQKYPVMVYIHGGQFSRGASNLFPAHMLAAFYNVVVVSFNYRLGALGFLSTADDNSPGNYGLQDQAMALRWVHDNAAWFNGDRDAITLFGPGAGAASAGLLALLPATRDLVARVIAQSGSALADWAVTEDRFRVQNTSVVFARALGCPADSSWRMLNCLRQGRSFYEIGNAEFQPQVGLYPWGPVLEANFSYPGDEWYPGWRARDWRCLDEMPEDSVKRGRFNRALSYMTGVTTQEAAYMLFTNESLAPTYEITEAFFEQKVAELVLRYNYTLNPRGVFDAVRYMYTYHPEPHNASAVRDQYVHLLSDFLYRAPTDKMVKLLLEQGVPVYMYVLNTTVEAMRWPEWRRYPHDTEHLFLTGAPFMDQEFFPRKDRLDRQAWTGNDRNMSHFFMKAYSDFARYGNPTRSRILGVHMEAAARGALRYLNLNTTYNSSVLLNYRQTELAFWTVYVPQVVGRRMPVYPPVTEYWWEPKRPLQIAFWSVSSVCLLLVVLLVVCCMLWRHAKRETDRYYSGDIFTVTELDEAALDARSRDNIYEYRDIPVKSAPSEPTLSRTTSPPTLSRPPSAASTGSGLSLKDAPQVGLYPWGPVLEANFSYPGDEWYPGWRARDWRCLDEMPEDSVKRGRFNRALSYMTGVTTQEAAYMLFTNESLAPTYEITEAFFEQKVAELVLRYNYTLNPRGVFDAVRYMYTYHPEPHNASAVRDQYVHLLSDFLYRAPTDKMVKLLLEQGVPVYMYVLNTTVEAMRWPEWRRYPHDTEHLFLTGAPFMDQEFFPRKDRLDRQAWTGNDRNMSHFFMKAYSDFARYGNPTRSRILGVHMEAAARGALRYLNLNTTYNSSVLLNYRQTELAFWTVYVPQVVGRRMPVYPPVTEYWWEPKRPLQIAFWSVSSVCLLLVVLLVVCCMLWRHAKRETDRYYSGDIFTVTELDEAALDARSRDNIYEYRDIPVKSAPSEPTLSRTTSPPTLSRPPSAASTGSGLSLKDAVSSSPAPRTPRPRAPLPRARSRTQIVHGVPQTTV